MDQDHSERMTPFDVLVTSPPLQIMKLLIPYTPFPGRRMLASFIKFTELQKTIRLFGHDCRTDPFSKEGTGQSAPSPTDLIDSLRPYLNPKDAEMLDTLIQLKEMMAFMEMIQPPQDASFQPADLFSGAFSSDFQEQFRMYSDLFSSAFQNTEHDTAATQTDSDPDCTCKAEEYVKEDSEENTKENTEKNSENYDKN